MHIVVTPIRRQFDVAYRVLAVRVAPGAVVEEDAKRIFCGPPETVIGYLATWHQLHHAVMVGFSVTLLSEDPYDTYHL